MKKLLLACSLVLLAGLSQAKELVIVIDWPESKNISVTGISESGVRTPESAPYTVNYDPIVKWEVKNTDTNEIIGVVDNVSGTATITDQPPTITVTK